MSPEAATATDEQAQVEQNPPAPEESGLEENAPPDLSEAVKTILSKERRAAREAERRAKAAESALAERQQAEMTELERTRERAERAEREAQEAKAEAMRRRVAGRLAVPEALVERLRGDTEEALEEDARSLLGALEAREPKQETRTASTPAARTGRTPPKEPSSDPERDMGEQLLAFLSDR